MVFSKENRYGLFGTITIHAGLLMLLLFIWFTAYPPLAGEEGITVNFGDSETGLGDIEPSPAISQEEPTQTVKQEEVPAVTPSAPAVKEKMKPAKEEVETQELERTAAVEAAKKKNEENRLKQLEIDKQRRQELEQQRLAAEAIKKQEADNRRISEIDSRTKGAFGKANGGTGGTGSGNGQSQGISYPGGNQGVPTGDPNSGNYGPGGKGNGTRGTGISYSLGNRTATSTPKPNFPGQEEGTVVVKITVDKNGNVTQAEPGQKGTTTMNSELQDAAKRAALQAKFNVDNDAPAYQTGTITYRFIIQSQ